MEGPPLGPGVEDITWSGRWPPGAEERLVPETSNLQPQTWISMLLNFRCMCVLFYYFHSAHGPAMSL